jgi:hypothetical protein
MLTDFARSCNNVTSWSGRVTVDRRALRGFRLLVTGRAGHGGTRQHMNFGRGAAKTPALSEEPISVGGDGEQRDQHPTSRIDADVRVLPDPLRAGGSRRRHPLRCVRSDPMMGWVMTGPELLFGFADVGLWARPPGVERRGGQVGPAAKVSAASGGDKFPWAGGKERAWVSVGHSPPDRCHSGDSC